MARLRFAKDRRPSQRDPLELLIRASGRIYLDLTLHPAADASRHFSRDWQQYSSVVSAASREARQPVKVPENLAIPTCNVFEFSALKSLAIIGISEAQLALLSNVAASVLVDTTLFVTNTAQQVVNLSPHTTLIARKWFKTIYSVDIHFSLSNNNNGDDETTPIVHSTDFRPLLKCA